MNEDLTARAGGAADPTGGQPSDSFSGSHAIGVGCASSMENQGWIKLHRSILNHWVMKNHKVMSVWIHLLLSATHKPIRVQFGGDLITLQPGQLTCGRRQIAEATGLSEKNVRTALELLKNDQQIGQQISNRCSLISITNWAKYQENGQQIGQQTASKRPANGQQTATKQECKNVRMKEERENAPALSTDAQRPTFQEFFTYIRKVNTEIPEEAAKDKWLAQEQANPPWGKVGNWWAYADRVIGWWVKDGKPKSYGKNQGNKPNPRNIGCTTDTAKQSRLIVETAKRREAERARQEAMRHEMAGEMAGPGRDTPTSADHGHSNGALPGQVVSQ